MNYAIAIDIGGTNTRVALINENYEIEERQQFATDAQNPYVTIEEIRKTIQRFGKEAKGIGISCPGPLDLLHGYILTTTNLGEKWWNYPICEKLSEATGLPVYLENDANLACLAEAVIGRGKDYHYVQFMTVSTGVGSGLVINKKIYQGAHGFAHEIANIPLWKDGPTHGSIYPGGVEAICSGTAITARANKAGLNVAHAGEVNDLAESGNETAMQIIDDAKEFLANAIAIIYAFIDPDIVILGGSVALKIPGFVEDVEMRVKSSPLSIFIGGSLISSTPAMALSIPLPRFSHRLNMNIDWAIFSLRDFGGMSMKRLVSMRGAPGLVIVSLFPKISMDSVIPCISKFWCIKALATNSRIETSG